MHMHILNEWPRIRNPTSLIDAYLFEEQSCQIIPIQYEMTELWVLLKIVPQQKQEKEQQQRDE